MPWYIVSHRDPISSSQRDELASAITKVHTNLFTTPSLFVNVRFEDASKAHHYVGGKPKLVNCIQAHVRSGPSRSRSSYNELCRQLRAAWESVLATTPLDTISVHGSLVAGEENGFLRPEAGHDAEWVRENMPEFERLAAAGDEEMRALVEECRTRGLGV
ncbi:hypothetical protein N8I77_003862 [Diaporthe amygdali]|uniref:Tautomerase cis-CaaD-like domain-containing protein n=1 Tax=Phomopsis amygdali TaxID=1214568 RepID=A0AAD9W5B8_PHOAM|nr:hypothetical protein N8I77_003862 [Diaporthe amygdali]